MEKYFTVVFNISFVLYTLSVEKFKKENNGNLIFEQNSNNIIVRNKNKHEQLPTN